MWFFLYDIAKVNALMLALRRDTNTTLTKYSILIELGVKVTSSCVHTQETVKEIASLESQWLQ